MGAVADGGATAEGRARAGRAVRAGVLVGRLCRCEGVAFFVRRCIQAGTCFDGAPAARVGWGQVMVLVPGRGLVVFVLSEDFGRSLPSQLKGSYRALSPAAFSPAPPPREAVTVAGRAAAVRRVAAAWWVGVWRAAGMVEREEKKKGSALAALFNPAPQCSAAFSFLTRAWVGARFTTTYHTSTHPTVTQ